MLPPELTNTTEQFIVYVHRNEAHFTYIYVYHTNVFEADSIYKKPPPNVISHIYIFFCYFFRSGAPPMTLLTAGALTDPQLPATASNVCTTDAWLSGIGRVPPQTKILATPVLTISNRDTGMASWPSHKQVMHSSSSLAFSLFGVGASNFQPPRSPVLCFFYLYSFLIHVFFL